MSKKPKGGTDEPIPLVRIEPIRNKILVDPDPEDEKVGSIYLPQGGVEMKRFVGTVISTGDGFSSDRVDFGGNAIKVPLAVKSGDRIIYNKYSGAFVEYPVHSGHEYLIITEDDILAVIRE